MLTDGIHVARTRCGNQVADVPGEVSPFEPPAEEMEVPIATVPLALLPHIVFPKHLPSALFPGASPFLAGRPVGLGVPAMPGIPGSLPPGAGQSDASPEASETGLLPPPDTVPMSPGPPPGSS